ncbi:MAG TPA: hypothetical protein VK586_12885 [Streptosporangiaceae bacterium]|nr:hypothetical protein [Streptosporangiaceae bacterium]
MVAAILAGAKTTTTGLALDESVAEWRSAHEEEWHSAEKRAVLGDPGFTVGADTAVQAQRFRLVPAPPDGHGPAAEPGA